MPSKTLPKCSWPGVKPQRQYPVVWDDRPCERALWRPDETFQPVLELIDTVAHDHGRTRFVDEPIPLENVFQVPFAVNADRELVLGAPETEDRRAVVMTQTIHRAVRELAREDLAIIFRQIDDKGSDGVTRRKISVGWHRQTKTPARLIRSLLNSVNSGSQYKLEAAWFGLTPRAHEYLSAGYRIACQQGVLTGYKGPFEVAGTIIPRPMLASGLLAVILPYATLAVANPGNKPVHPRDETLGRVLNIFAQITARPSGLICGGDGEGPSGPGEEFLSAIEAIFHVHLLPRGSQHAVDRARKWRSGSTGSSAQIWQSGAD